MSRGLSLVEEEKLAFPHKKYLLYLFSKKKQIFEVTSLCSDMDFVPPSNSDAKDLIRELGRFPTSWQKDTSGAESSFRNWLKRKGILDAWRQSESFVEATSFLYKTAPRRDFEAIYLVQGDLEAAREELLAKYPSAAIPSISSLETYVDYYWDLGSLNYNEIMRYLERSQSRRELLPALEGDMSSIYAQYGIQQKVSDELFYNNLIALTNQQIQRARRVEELNGSTLMGIAALARQAGDAIAARRELNAAATPTIDAIKKQASDFFRVKMEKQKEIVSIDEIVIDLEEDENDNVRKLKARR